MSSVKEKLVEMVLALIVVMPMVSATPLVAFAADLQTTDMLQTQAAPIAYDTVCGVYGSEYALMCKQITYRHVGDDGTVDERKGYVTDLMRVDGSITAHLSDYEQQDDENIGGWSDYALSAVDRVDKDMQSGYIAVTQKSTGKVGVMTLEGKLIVPCSFSVVKECGDDFVGVLYDNSTATARFYTPTGIECGSVSYPIEGRPRYTFVNQYGAYVRVATQVGFTWFSGGLVKKGSSYEKPIGIDTILDGEKSGAILAVVSGDVYYFNSQGEKTKIRSYDNVAKADLSGSFIEFTYRAGQPEGTEFYNTSGKKLQFNGYTPAMLLADVAHDSYVGDFILMADFVSGGPRYALFDSDGNVVRKLDVEYACVLDSGHYYVMNKEDDGRYRVLIYNPNGTLVKDLGLFGGTHIAFGSVVDDEGETIGYMRSATDSDGYHTSTSVYYDLDFEVIPSSPSSIRPVLADGTEVVASVTEKDGVYTASVTDASGNAIKLGGYTLGIAINPQPYAEGNFVKHGNADLWWATNAAGRWGAVDSSGNVKVPFEYESYYDAGQANTDYAMVKKDSAWSFLKVASSAKSDLASYEGTAAASGMSDLKAGEWYMTPSTGAFSGTKTLYLDYAIARGLMGGYKDASGQATLFGARDTLNRAQTATILYRLANPDSKATTDQAHYENNKTPLSDVESGQYYTAAVNWCVAKGVITGYKDAAGRPYAFGPNDPVTREQLATMISRYCTEYAGRPATAADITAFADYAEIGDWARGGVAYCVANKIVGGYTDGSNCFGPQDSAERCQMAKIIAVTAYMLG